MFCLSKVDQEVDNYWQKGDDAAQSVKGYDCSIIYIDLKKKIENISCFLYSAANTVVDWGKEYDCFLFYERK